MLKRRLATPTPARVTLPLFIGIYAYFKFHQNAPTRRLNRAKFLENEI